MKGQVKICFGELKIPVRYLINYSREDSEELVCKFMIFSTLCTTLLHNLIKEKLINLIEWTFKRDCSPYIACNERQAFFISGDTKRYKLWSCQNACEALLYLLDNIYIRYGIMLYRQIVGIPMVTNCASLVADLFLF